MPTLVDQRVIEITGSNTVWFTHVPPPGVHTLILTFPSGVTGTLKVVVAVDPNDPDNIAPAKKDGTQISFASGGTYASEAFDITGGKAIGVEGDSVIGGAAKAYLRQSE